MSTWVGAIIETAGRADFWDVARKHGVDTTTQDIPKYVLIESEGFDFQASTRLAEAMSKELGATAIGFVVQTTVDAHELYAFRNGAAIRRLGYSRDGEGWDLVEGTPQTWERAYFFVDEDDMLWDDMSDEDVARYEAARQAGDATPVLDLMHPSSTAPMHRVCATFDVRPDQPHGRLKKRSFLARLFGRS